MKQNLTLKKMLFISLLTAQGIILSLLEQAIPFPFAFAPGAKLGVANIITVIGLYTLSLQEVVLVVLLRTLLTALLGGTFSTLLYSSAGAAFSLLGMLLVKKLGPKRVSLIGVSATGGILHNFGQLVIASFIAKSWIVLLYLPAMSIVGIFAGIAIGIAANYALNHVKILKTYREKQEL